MELSWAKCAGEWCLLEQIDLPAVDQHGVFVLWRDGDLQHVSTVLYVGRGALRYEIERCRRELLFRGSPGLRITWATINDVRLVDGVAAFLYQRLRPLWGDSVPTAQSLPVNLPAA